MLTYVSENGFQNIPTAWVHEADKKRKVREFVKGSLRLFFFNGTGNQIAVCVVGKMKKGNKADKASVEKTAKCQAEYFEAVSNNVLEVEINEDQ